MNNLKNLQPKQFLKDEIIKKIQEKTEGIILHFESKQAWQLLNLIDKKLSQISDLEIEFSDIFKIYEKIIAKLKFIAFFYLSTSQIKDLFRWHIDIGLKIDIDLIDILKSKIIVFPITEADRLKQDISLILENSNILITRNRIKIENMENILPSVKNWLKDRRMYLGNKVDDTLAKSQYFINSQNIKNLSYKEKEILKKLFDFYDFINTSGVFPEGYPGDILIKWPDKEMQILDEGQLIDLEVPTISSNKAKKHNLNVQKSKQPKDNPYLKNLKNLIQKYPKASLERKALEEEMKKYN